MFGVVSTGFTAGGVVTRLVFGWVLDHGDPSWVFLAAAAMFVVLLTVSGAKATG